MDAQRRKEIEDYIAVCSLWTTRALVQELLAEIDRLEAELETYAAEFCPHVKLLPCE